ncbi:hypothetical protein KI688_006347 [Linnemannia hyalina]|uniref:Protein kinase domain-containing protein n=1 Tax=Linnemannia hyalina TaxID=64524 RepID=A0A9P7Y4G5_9FUNG|nr:hypothetical protein KI688_006347 [Linnemannia hyalina]
MDSNSVYRPEDLGSDANENDIPEVNDRPAPNPKKIRTRPSSWVGYEDKRGPYLLIPLYRSWNFYVLLINRAPLLVPEIKFFNKQLVAGLSFILEAGIRHCDLKSENVLVAEGIHLKITDFGLSEESSVKRNSVIYPPEDYLEGVPPSEDVRNLLDRTLEIDVEHRINVHELANHNFLCRDFASRVFPIRRSTWPRCLTITLLKTHARTSENNAEVSRAWKRKKRRSEKAAVKDHEIRVNQRSHATVCVVAAKGKEVVHWCRVNTKSGTEAITDANANADATTKDHSARTRNQGDT